MTTFTTNTKSIFESTDKGAYTAFCQEIARYKAAGNRLDSIVNKGIFAGCNQLRATVSLNRVNALALALRDCGEKTRLTKIQRMPEYLGMSHAIAWDKKTGVFYFTNYAAAKNHAPNMAVPAMKYLDWVAENKPAKVEKPITLETATRKLATLYKSLQSCNAPELTTIKAALQEYLAQHDRASAAQEELQKIRSSLA